MPTFRPRRRFWAPLLASTLALSFGAVNQKPADAATRPQQGQSVTLRMGESKTISVSKVKRFSVFVPSILTVKILSPNEIELTARSGGQTVVYVWDDRGLSTYTVDIAYEYYVDPEDYKRQILGQSLGSISSSDENSLGLYTVSGGKSFSLTAPNQTAFGSLNLSHMLSYQFPYGPDATLGFQTSFTNDLSRRTSLQINGFSAKYRQKDQITFTFGDGAAQTGNLGTSFATPPAVRGFTAAFSGEGFNTGLWLGRLTRSITPLRRVSSLTGLQEDAVQLGAASSHAFPNKLYLSSIVKAYFPDVVTQFQPPSLMGELGFDWRLSEQLHARSSLARNLTDFAFLTSAGGRWQDLNYNASYRRIGENFVPQASGQLGLQQGFSTGIGYNLAKIGQVSASYGQDSNYLNLSRSFSGSFATSIKTPPIFNRVSKDPIPVTWGLGYSYNDATLGSLSNEAIQGNIVYPLHPTSTLGFDMAYNRRSDLEIGRESLTLFGLSWQQNLDHMGSYNVNYRGTVKDGNLTSNFAWQYGQRLKDYTLSAGLGFYDGGRITAGRGWRPQLSVSTYQFLFDLIKLSEALTYTGSYDIPLRRLDNGLSLNLQGQMAIDFAHLINFGLSIGTSFVNPSEIVKSTSIGGSLGYNYRFGNAVALFSPKTTLKGTLFEDSNMNRRLDDQDNRLSNVRLTLSNGQARSTDAKGAYTFTDVPFGTYDLVVDDKTLPAGMFPLSTGNEKLEIRSYKPIETDFGFTKMVTLRGYVYNDLNLNRKLDDSDMGLKGIRVMGPNDAETLTDGMGYYEMMLPQGEVDLKLDYTTIPLNFQLRSRQAVKVNLTPDPETNVADFMVNANRLVSGRVFWDLNRNNRFDDGDRPAIGAKIAVSNEFGETVGEEGTVPNSLDDAMGKEGLVYDDPQSQKTTGEGDPTSGAASTDGIVTFNEEVGDVEPESTVPAEEPTAPTEVTETISRTVQTDETGRYLLRSLPAGKINIRATLDQVSSPSFTLDLDGYPGNRNLDLILLEPPNKKIAPPPKSKKQTQQSDSKDPLLEVMSDDSPTPSVSKEEAIDLSFSFDDEDVRVVAALPGDEVQPKKPRPAPAFVIPMALPTVEYTVPVPSVPPVPMAIALPLPTAFYEPESLPSAMPKSTALPEAVKIALNPPLVFAEVENPPAAPTLPIAIELSMPIAFYEPKAIPSAIVPSISPIEIALTAPTATFEIEQPVMQPQPVAALPEPIPSVVPIVESKVATSPSLPPIAIIPAPVKIAMTAPTVFFAPEAAPIIVAKSIPSPAPIVIAEVKPELPKASAIPSISPTSKPFTVADKPSAPSSAPSLLPAPMMVVVEIAKPVPSAAPTSVPVAVAKPEALIAPAASPVPIETLPQPTASAVAKREPQTTPSAQPTLAPVQPAPSATLTPLRVAIAPPEPKDPLPLPAPSAAPSPAVESNASDADGDELETISYTVRKGDSLKAIALRLLGDRDRWSEIYALNPNALKSGNRLQPGDVIFVPKPETVILAGQGQTLSDQAVLTSPAERMVEPPAASSDQFVGPDMPVPGPTILPSAPPEPQTDEAGLYTVKAGDTIFAIARSLLDDVERWKEIADANPDLIREDLELTAGMKIKIPQKEKALEAKLTQGPWQAPDPRQIDWSKSP